MRGPEGNLSGGAYVLVPEGEWVEFDITEAAVLHGLIWRQAAAAGEAVWEVRADGRSRTVTTPAGGTGPRGLTEADGSLLPQRLGECAPGSIVRCTSHGDVRLDALVVQPLLTTAVYDTDAGAAALYVNSTASDRRAAAVSTGDGRTYDWAGAQHGQAARSGAVRVRGGGFTITLDR